MNIQIDFLFKMAALIFMAWFFVGAILGGLIHNLNKILMGTEYLGDNWNYNEKREPIKVKRTCINYILHFLELILLFPLLLICNLNANKEATKTVEKTVKIYPLAKFCAVVLYILTIFIINYFISR